MYLNKNGFPSHILFKIEININMTGLSVKLIGGLAY